jgi:hypothetical protein
VYYANAGDGVKTVRNLFQGRPDEHLRCNITYGRVNIVSKIAEFAVLKDGLHVEILTLILQHCVIADNVRMLAQEV